MTLNLPDAEKNFNEFIQKHGETGLVQLFFTNYLFDLIKYYLESQDITNKENDPGYLMYFNFKNVPYTVAQTDEFFSDLQSECTDYAKKIIVKLTETNKLSFLEPINDTSLSLLNDAVEKIVRKLGD